jgi:hypothetical protein
VVECIRDHVRLLDDLPNGTTLVQKIVASSVFSVTEIIVIEDQKLNSTFLHVAFGSQSLLKPISGKLALIPIEELKKMTRGRGVNGSQSKFITET